MKNAATTEIAMAQRQKNRRPNVFSRRVIAGETIDFSYSRILNHRKAWPVFLSLLLILLSKVISFSLCKFRLVIQAFRFLKIKSFAGISLLFLSSHGPRLVRTWWQRWDSNRRFRRDWCKRDGQRPREAKRGIRGLLRDGRA